MPAAGAGRRFGSAKQYAPLRERTVLEVSLQPFLDDAQCAGGSLVLAADDPQRERLQRVLPGKMQLIDGGEERVHSVRNGLQALSQRAAAQDWVLVHDAARPMLSAGDLAALLQQGGADAVGALLAVPVADTVKRARSGQTAVPSGAVRCETTMAREGLWLAQTPQMFRFAPLCEALERALSVGRRPTDEAQAMEWQGHAALLVASRDPNLKVTTRADLMLAEAILQQRAT
ncbi:MAG TPA: 2-C-methyl-D-erythritol 4-phosphate cytidylyltransferase [Steroidobacteraceae bacterium]|nr:2-C-methyl-D-erythritol 4-phosphate cytidylyltransferase [Steroidobacteraceae bacterium]